MSKIIANTFTTFELNEQEELQGCILSINQKQVIQNMLASVAEEKINLELDVTVPQQFIQEEASLKGQMDILRNILDKSTVAEDIVMNGSNIQSD